MYLPTPLLSLCILATLCSFALSAPALPPSPGFRGVEAEAKRDAGISNSTSVLTVDESTATSLIVYHAGASATATDSTSDTDSESVSLISTGTLDATPTTTFSLLGALTTTASGSDSGSGAVVAAASESSTSTSTSTSTSVGHRGARYTTLGTVGGTVLAFTVFAVAL